MTKSKFLSQRSRRRGAVVVLVAVSLTILLTFVAIAVEGGSLMERVRHTQATADMAALAAAEDLFRKYATNKGVDSGNSAANKAIAIATANGYTNGVSNAVVTIRMSPQKYFSGPDEGAVIPAGYAEVTIQYNQPRYFSAAIGSQSIPVVARAVARGKWEPSKIGIHVLDLSTKASLTSVGSGTATVSGGASVIVNSSDAEAAVSISGSLTASEFNITGGSTGSGFVGTMNYGVSPEPDPLRHLPEPDISTLTVQSNHKLTISNNAPKTLSPGIYKGGISITGNGNVTMLPGIYYMDGGGFSITGGGTLTGTGIMLYNAPNGPSDNITFSGTNGATVNISPPTSGPYTGISIFQERAASNPVSVSGNAAFDITGTFYAAGAQVLVGGNGNSVIGSQYISKYLAIVGNGDFKCDYDPTQVAPTRVLGLVE
jgi:Flp pilus assembly protein TadG